MTDNPSPSDIRQEDVREEIHRVLTYYFYTGEPGEHDAIETAADVLAALSAQTGEPEWREFVRRLVVEFDDYHYAGCPKEESDNAQCSCFAGALISEAKSALASPPPQPDTAPVSGRIVGGAAPCPFCGAPAKLGDDPLKPVLYCDNDDCFGPHTTAGNLDDAIRQWNTRHQPDTAPSPLSTGEVRAFDTTGTILRRSYNVFTIICEDWTVANRVADQLRTPLAQPAATEQIRVIEALTLLLAAAKFMPRTTPKPGGASTQHDYKIEAAYVWALDAACKAAERVLAATEQARS